MRIKNLLQFVFVLIAGQLLFACNAPKYYEFAANKQAPYFENKQKVKPGATEEQSLTAIAIEAAEDKATKSVEVPVLEASVAEKPVALPAAKPAPVVKTETTTPENVLTETEALEMVNERLANMTKAEKKELKKEMREAYKQSGSRTSIVEIILAVLLPPLAVFLHDGIGTSFWISIILTLLFWVPGVIYALLVVTDTI
jgi:uncharacterized membrane protein YqaE (UPF0057 family)